jgi:hypothetical protein
MAGGEAFFDTNFKHERISPPRSAVRGRHFS